MEPTKYPLSIEVYQSWIEALNDDKLTKWEFDFVADIQVRLESNRNLTERQAEILERIYVEKGK